MSMMMVMGEMHEETVYQFAEAPGTDFPILTPEF
jgi:hypothetical protein